MTSLKLAAPLFALVLRRVETARMFKRYKTGDCYLLVGVIITVDHIVGTIGDKTTGEIIGRTVQVIKPRFGFCEEIFD